MTRTECESRIAEKLNEIREIHSQYNPKGMFLTLTVTNEYVSGFNEYYDAPIDFRQYNGEPIIRTDYVAQARGR